ncbi:hypothetical protein HII31_10038 [Pseudocercospora fuligena]|uniref:Uncharacterized protein n=1 Tax=Pseudocercospora fuligena TaxID=685502 RepID=A0A8H6RE43_9PEZI|nr:hypothetical protein HII31_10038 [Pseudocercospora fuligena]
MEQHFVEEGNPPSGTCWPCRKCKPNDGFACFFRGHLGCCQELNYAGHKCGMLFTMERGCMYHPYGLGYNKDIKPTRDPFAPRGEVFRMPEYTHDQKALGIDPKAPKRQNFFFRTEFAKKMRQLQRERAEKEKDAAKEPAEPSPAAVVKDARKQSATEAPVTDCPTAAEPIKTESSPPTTVKEQTISDRSESSSSKRRPSTSTRSRKESYSTLACGAETISVPLASNMVRGH